MKVFVVIRNDSDIAGVCRTKKDANLHIADSIQRGFLSANRWDIIEYNVIKFTDLSRYFKN